MTDWLILTVYVVVVYFGGVFLFMLPTYLNIRWLYFLIPVFLATLPEYLLVISNPLSYCNKLSKLILLELAFINNVELAFLWRNLLSLFGSTDADLKLVVELEWFCDCFSLYILVDMFSYLKELNSNFGLDISF